MPQRTPVKFVTFFVNAVYNKYQARYFYPPGESTLNKAIEVPMRIKCLLVITGALIMFLIIATLAYAFIATVP